MDRKKMNVHEVERAKSSLENDSTCRLVDFSCPPGDEVSISETYAWHVYKYM